MSAGVLGRFSFLGVLALQVRQTYMIIAITNKILKTQAVTQYVLNTTVCRQYIQPVPAAKKRSYLSLLLLLTDLAWIATYLASMGLNDWAFENLKLNPMAGGSARTLTTLGAVDYDRVVNGHEWWRIVAAPFLCSGQPLATHNDCNLASGTCCRAAAPAAPSMS